MKAQKGFTLIELIIVIVVLGILAVTAAPQFINFAGDARGSTLNGLKGAMNGAAQTIYAKAAIQGLEDDQADGASYHSVSSVDIVYGYPAANSTGITAALQIESADWDIAYSGSGDPTVQDTAKFSPAGINDDFSATDPSTITECFVEYIDVATEGNLPGITVDTTGC